MSVEQLTPQELHQRIIKAWSRNRIPGEKHLFSNERDLEDYPQLIGLAWQDIPIELLRYHHHAVFYFKPKAYRYYLPAFMDACLLKYPDAGDIMTSLIECLTYPSEDKDRKRFMARHNPLTPEQKKLIRLFLLHLINQKKDRQAEIAFNKFWYQFD